MIEFIKIGKSFDEGKTWAINNITLQSRPGETLILIGTSGAGKSTLLKMVNRLIHPSTGEVRIDGENINEMDIIELRRNIGYVFQSIGLFPHMTILENISIIHKLTKTPLTSRIKIANDLLDLVGLAPDIYKNRYPSMLSGGEQQRVGIARALSTNPKYILMDEPFGSLDAYTRSGLQQVMLQLKQELKKTIIFVTHDIAEAFKLGDKITILHKGKLEQLGTPQELLHNPTTDFCKQLFQTFTKQMLIAKEYFP